MFERFLNPERGNMPDFDIDFCIEGRQQVKDYVYRKYGTDKVCEIVAFDTLKARAAVRDAGRVMGVSYQLCDRVAKLIDQKLTLAECLEISDELKSLYKSDRTVHRLIDISKSIEGMPRHTSIHAAGVIISAVPLDELVPLQKSDDTIIAQYTMTYLEGLGLLKMDFLGLRNLTIIRDAVREIKKHEPEFDIDSIPTDDKEIYRMLSRGDTAGVFQFESEGMTQKLISLAPERLEDLIVVLSLYRPGPMKSIPVYIANKREPERIEYAHPKLRDILSDTYGVMVYQEQVMEICRKLAGYSYGHADLVRRAMAKKIPEKMLAERGSFVSGAKENGVDETTANRIFDDMVSFASYAFNKSHAAAYAYLSYQTAYLKCHYRGIYMAALMSSVVSNTAKVTDYISDCIDHGIQVLCPDINRSEKGFTFIDGKMYFGLMAVKNAGGQLAESIIAERRQGGRYTGLQDFCERISGRVLNKKALENLIKAGAFDGLGLNRRQMLENYEKIMEASESAGRGVIEGQLDLLGGIETEELGIRIPQLPEFDSRKLLNMEKEAAGMYLSGSPLSEYHYLGELMHCTKIGNLSDLGDGRQVKLLCVVQTKKLHVTKKGDKMCFVTLADETGEIEAVIFPDLFSVSASRIIEDNILIVSGKVSLKDDSAAIVSSSVVAEQEFERLTDNMKLCIKTESTKLDRIYTLEEICRRYRGSTEVCAYLTDLKKMVKPKKQLKLKITPESVQELKKYYSSAETGLIQ